MAEPEEAAVDNAEGEGEEGSVDGADDNAAPANPAQEDEQEGEEGEAANEGEKEDGEKKGGEEEEGEGEGNLETEMLTKERDVLKQLIAEREMYDYLMSDLRKLRRGHQYVDKTTKTNSRAEKLKAEIHKLHMLHQEYEEFEEDPGFELEELKHELGKLTAENDALQRAVDSSRIDVLKEELKDVDSNMEKLQRQVLEDRIAHALVQQELAQKHLKRMQNLKEMGVNLPKRDVLLETREEEAERIKEEMQRKKYQEDIERIRRKRNSVPNTSNRKLARDEKTSPRHRSSRMHRRPQQQLGFYDYGNFERDYIEKYRTSRNFAGQNIGPESFQRLEDDAGSGVEVTYEYEPEMSRKKNLQDRKAEPNSEKVWICELYQSRDQCKFKDDHYAHKDGKHVILRHVCARCYKVSGELNKHPMSSTLCHSRIHGFDSAATTPVRKKREKSDSNEDALYNQGEAGSRKNSGSMTQNEAFFYD